MAEEGSPPEERGVSRVRKWLGRLALVVLSTLIGLVAAELLARRYLVAENYSFEVWDGFDNLLEKGFYAPDDELGFVPGPKWPSKKGMLGCQNGKEFDLEKDAKDLLILGDSIVYHRSLEKSFKKLLKHKGFRVWSAGIPGYNTLQEIVYLKKHIEFESEAVVLSFCENDFFPAMIIVSSEVKAKGTFAMPRIDPLAIVHPRLFKHSALYRYFKVSAVARANVEMYSPENIRANRDLVVAGMKAFKQWSAETGTPLVVIVYPHLSKPEKEWESAAHLEAVAILEELEMPFIDMHDDFYDYGIERIRQKPEDIVHPNLTGHMMAARKLLARYRADIGLPPETPESEKDRPEIGGTK
jgi:hypothetical protein